MRRTARIEPIRAWCGMQGTVSFHPVNPAFFEEAIEPLLSGGKMRPDPFLERAARLRAVWHRTRRYIRAIEAVLDEAAPPGPATGAGLLSRIRAVIEHLDHPVPETARRAAEVVEPNLHLRGRPFFITEGSAARVGDLVDEYVNAPDGAAVDALALEQLIGLDAELGRSVKPRDGPELSADFSYRSDLLGELRGIHAVARGGGRASGADVAWKALALHARVTPFWIAEDVDGIETVCRAAGLEPPPFLASPRTLLPTASERFPDWFDRWSPDLTGSRDVGTYVCPDDVPRLQMFLASNGSRIIQAATQYGEGSACATLLRKIRECLTYAERRGLGYLEASGIVAPDLCQDEPEE